jgi:tRNA(fMet)-specific endonuclease VapC
MPRFMLDTNTVSYALRGSPPLVRERLRNVPLSQVCISSITEAELLAGLALKPEATNLAASVTKFLLGVSVLPWDSSAAKSYASLYSASRNHGRSLAAIDLLVAAHARSTGLILVTSDRAFHNLRPRLRLADWTKTRHRVPGSMKGKLRVGPEFFDP